MAHAGIKYSLFLAPIVNRCCDFLGPHAMENSNVMDSTLLDHLLLGEPSSQGQIVRNVIDKVKEIREN